HAGRFRPAAQIERAEIEQSEWRFRPVRGDRAGTDLAADAAATKLRERLVRDPAGVGNDPPCAGVRRTLRRPRDEQHLLAVADTQCERALEAALAEDPFPDIRPHQGSARAKVRIPEAPPAFGEAERQIDPPLGPRALEK